MAALAFTDLLRRINRLLNVRGREWPLLGFLLAHFATSQLTMTLLQSTHLGLLLNVFGRESLPFYFLAKGVCLLGISWFYSVGLIGRISRQLEILSFLAMLCLALLVTRVLILVDAGWVNLSYLGLSVFAEVFVSIFTLQCWGLYSDCMDSRQSKRLMPLIGAGGTLGAIIGGWLASILAHPLGAENLLIVCFFFTTCVCLLSFRLLTGALSESPAGVSEEEQGQLWSSMLSKSKKLFGMVLSHRLLLIFMLIIMSVKLGSNLTEYQQQVLLRQNLSKDGITAFLGSFLAATNLLALLLQLFFENRLIQSFGPLFGLLSTPFCQSLAALAFFGMPGLMTNSIGRSAEQLTHKSIYKTSVNLVYLSFPSELRRRLRVVINGLLECFAILPFVLITFLLPKLPLQGFSLGTLAAALFAIILVFALRRPYQQQLQDALQSRPLKVDAELEDDPLYSARSYAQLAESNLQSDDLRRIRFALELMMRRELPLGPELLEPLLLHRDSQIRRQAVSTLARYGGQQQNPAVFGLLAAEAEPEVRQAAIRSLRNWSDERNNKALSLYLDDPDPGVQAETLVALFTCGGIEGILRAGSRLKDLLKSEQESELKAAAYVIGEIGSAYFRKDLARLLNHPETRIQLEAIRAIGKSPDEYWISQLLARLGSSQSALAQQVGLSLRHFPGPQIVPALAAAYERQESIQGPEGDIRLRAEIIRILDAFEGKDSIQLLQSWLQRADWRLKAPILRVLNHLYHSADEFNEQLLYLEIQSVLRDAYACVEVLWLLRSEQDPRVELLANEIAFGLRYNQDLVFRLLALLYEPERIVQASLNYASGDSHYKALSLDLLSQMLGRSLGPPIINLLEDAPLDKKVSFARAQALLAEREDRRWWERPLIQDHIRLRQLARWCRYNKGDQDLGALKPMLDTIYLLKQTPLFASLAIEQLEPVARVCKPESFEADEIIFAEGTPGKALYIIRSGSVQVESEGRRLASLQTNEVFGEVEVLHAAPHLATIRTLEPCELLVISRQDFSDLIEDYPAFARGLVEILFDRLRSAFERARGEFPK